MGRNKAPAEMVSAYPPLPLERHGFHIRVLRLHPGRFGDQLHGTLRVVSLGEEARYEALSYTWGRSTMQPQPTIILNERYEVHITDNLYNALRRLRRRFLSRTLWVDAVCINQADIEERNHEVSIMGHVYRSARQVCVWLGDGPDLSILRRLLIANVPLGIGMIKFDEAERSWRRVPDSKAIQKFWSSFASPIHTWLIRAVAAALSQTYPRWHTRAWVYPELCNARRVNFCFGSCERAAHPFAFAQYLLYMGTLPLSGASDDWREWQYFIIGLGEILDWASESAWQDRESGFSYTSLLQNLASTVGLDASDPRDKVFSLRGVTASGEVASIKPDYNKTTAQIFAQATFAIITSAQNFDAFFYATGFGAFVELPEDYHMTSGLGRLPTWAADFSCRHRYFYPPFLLFGEDSNFQKQTAENAALPRLSPCLSQLNVHVMLLDRVCALMEVDATDKDDKIREHSEELRRRPRSTQLAPGHSGEYTLDPSQQQNVGFHALSAGSGGMTLPVRSGIENPSSDEVAASDYPDELFQWFSSVYAVVHDYDNSRELDPTTHGSRSSVLLLSRYLRHGFNLGFPSSMYVTSSGFLGVGSGNAKVGDSIAFLSNSRLPILLRPKGKEYYFVGMTHVGSLVSGELEAFWRRNDIRPEEVVLV